MRDAGLSIKAWLEINDNDYVTVKPEVDAYVDWVEMVQSIPDPNGIDIRLIIYISIIIHWWALTGKSDIFGNCKLSNESRPNNTQLF